MAKKPTITICRSEQCYSCANCADVVAVEDDNGEPENIIACNLEDHAVEGSGSECEHYQHSAKAEAKYGGFVDDDEQEDEEREQLKADEETIVTSKTVNAIFQGDSLVQIEKMRPGMEHVEVSVEFLNTWNSIVALLKQTTEEQITSLKQVLTKQLQDGKQRLLEDPAQAVLDGADSLLNGTDSDESEDDDEEEDAGDEELEDDELEDDNDEDEEDEELEDEEDEELEDGDEDEE